MTVSLENIASLKDNSLYYLSDKGEVKKAGLWTKFKYVANLGHSRERVNNLLNEVKNILLQQSEGKGAGKIEARLRETDISFGIKGSSIKLSLQGLIKKDSQFPSYLVIKLCFIISFKEILLLGQ